MITVVQEGRFLLASDDSRARLLVLAPDADLEPQDLPDLVRRACRVAVDYEPVEGSQAARARRVVELPSTPRPNHPTTRSRR